jgi:hypothetical protein
MRDALRLTGRQLGLLRKATGSLPYEKREQFVVDVSRRLASEPADDAVMRAINLSLDAAMTSVFFLNLFKSPSTDSGPAPPPTQRDKPR